MSPKSHDSIQEAHALFPAPGEAAQVRVLGVWLDGLVEEIDATEEGVRLQVYWSVGLGHERRCWYDAKDVRFIPPY